MKIGIDAKWFFHGNPSGRVVINNLLNEFVKMQNIHEFYFFLRNEDKKEIFPFSGKNIRLIHIWGRNNALSNIFVLPLVAKKLNLDIVLFQTFVPFLFFRKSVVFIHDCIYLTSPEYFTWIERIYYYPIKYLAAFAKHIITISESEKCRIIEKMKVIPSSISVVYHGVNKNYVPLDKIDLKIIKHVKEKYQLPNEYVLYVGRLNERKNLHNLIKSFIHIKNESIPLILVGAPQWKKFNTEKYLAENNIKNKIISLGFIPDSDLNSIYALAKIFCYISFDEGFGLPTIEAMACGIPVIVANAGSLPEICGEAGIYIDPLSPVDIAKKIDLLLENKSLYAEMKHKVIIRSKDFKWEKSASQIIKILEKI